MRWLILVLMLAGAWFQVLLGNPLADLRLVSNKMNETLAIFGAAKAVLPNMLN